MLLFLPFFTYAVPYGLFIFYISRIKNYINAGNRIPLIDKGRLMEHLKKKALISLETLIILIALIVVAAVAAGIIIRQSGLFQQRAVTVSEQSRERLVSGVEVVSVSATANISAEQMNDLSVLVRLKPGSLPIQLKNLKLLFTTQDLAMSASLQHTTMTDGFDDINISLVNTSWQDIGDVEDNILEASSTTEEQIRYSNADQRLEINLSYASNNPDADDEDDQAGVVAYISSLNLTSGNVIDLENEPVQVNGVTFAFVTISGTVVTNDSLDNLTATIHNFPSSNICTFDNLIQERRFCFVNKIGNGDTTLETGEIAELRFNFKPFNELPIETIYELQFLPKEGAIETISAISPSTLVVEKTKLWG
ncbi:hypothetical protein C4573_00075 [Candidatus Woesearchaeota archaeon]|nr:MAG: hypothetical protein C4573_00075 [Candidatus Woesearchaeota archaeon]